MPSCFNVVPSVLLFLFSFHLIFHAWFPHDSDLSGCFQCLFPMFVSNFCFQFLFPYMMFIVFSPFSRGFPEVFPQVHPNSAPCRCRAPPPPLGRPGGRRLQHPATDGIDGLWKSMVYLLKMGGFSIVIPLKMVIFHSFPIENGYFHLCSMVNRWKNMENRWWCSMAMLNNLDGLPISRWWYTKTDVERDTCVISWFIFTYDIHICVWFVCRSTYILYINMTSKRAGWPLRMCFVGMGQVVGTKIKGGY